MTNHPRFTESHDSAARKSSSRTVTGTRITLLEPHGDVCWYFGKKPMVHTRHNRRSKGNRDFLVYRCLCPECPAKLAVLMNDVDKAIGLERTPRRGPQR